MSSARQRASAFGVDLILGCGAVIPPSDVDEGRFEVVLTQTTKTT